MYTNLYLKSQQNAYLQEAERLLREEGNARIILETMPIGVIVADRSGAIQQLNQGARQIFIVETPTLEDYKDFIGWWPNTNRPIQHNEWAITRAIEKGETTLCELIQVQCSDGTKKTVLNSAVPFGTKAKSRAPWRSCRTSAANNTSKRN